MKLIKINPDHYIIVDDSEIIKEGDWIYSFDNELILQANKGSVDTISSKSFNGKGFAKITHSTQPLNDNPHYADYGIITLREVKELLGKVGVEKKALKPAIEYIAIYKDANTFDFRKGYETGYNQALKDNKNKKYTEEDLINALYSMWYKAKDGGFTIYEALKSSIEYIQPKTEWEVEFDEQGKLKLV